MIDVNLLFVSLSNDLDLDRSTVKYCLTRYKNEGIQFFTVTLPKLAQAVLLGTEFGFLDRSALTCFAWKGRSLRYFRSLLDKIYCPASGRLLDSPCPVAIWAVRQLCGYMYKLCLPMSDVTKQKALRKFLDCEARIIPMDRLYTPFIDRVRRNIETHFRFPGAYSDVLQSFRPRVGPGTFAGQAKVSGRRLSPFAYKVHPDIFGSAPLQFKDISGYFRPYPSCSKRLDYVPDTSDYSEVLFVPKDGRGPRTIVREPMKALSVQMAFFDFFSKFCEKQTFGRIQFHDQSTNQKLAQLGSIDGSYATFDLKDASDMVSNDLVSILFENVPVVSWFLRRTRTRHCKLPDGSLHRLRKLAGMGSGLTFAIMAFVIHVSVATLISKRFGISFKEASSHVYVYGDDLIVNSKYSSVVPLALNSVGLELNISKSYKRNDGKGCFRESCGGDYFSGNDVSIVRLKITSGIYHKGSFLIPLNKSHGVYQLCEHSAELLKHGLVNTSEYIYSLLEREYGPLPLSMHRTSYLSRYTYYTEYERDITGMYRKILAYQAVSTKLVAVKCPFFGISGDLLKTTLDCSEDSEAIALITKPRSVTLRKRRVSSLVFC